MFFLALMLAISLDGSFQQASNCSTHLTAMNDAYYGGLHWIDRHDMKCPTGYVINSWRMKSNGSAQYHFEYVCCQAYLSTCAEMTTNQTWADYAQSIGKFTTLADQTAIGCGLGRAMQQWQMQSNWTSSGNFIFFKLTCCHIDMSGREPGNCQDRATNFQTKGPGVYGDTRYIDRHNVSCDDESYPAMRQWRLDKDTTGNNVKISYQCCPLPRFACRPTESYAQCIACTGRRVPTTCYCQQRIGMEHSTSANLPIPQSIREELQQIYKWPNQPSLNASADWLLEPSSTFLPTTGLNPPTITTQRVGYGCENGKLCRFMQLIGNCGVYRIRSESFYIKTT